MKFGDEAAKKLEFPNIAHTPIVKLRFLLAGKEFGYPGFNGQVTSILLGATEGVFLQDEAGINRILDKLPKPEEFN